MRWETRYFQNTPSIKPKAINSVTTTDIFITLFWLLLPFMDFKNKFTSLRKVIKLLKNTNSSQESIEITHFN